MGLQSIGYITFANHMTRKSIQLFKLFSNNDIHQFLFNVEFHIFSLEVWWNQTQNIYFKFMWLKFTHVYMFVDSFTIYILYILLIPLILVGNHKYLVQGLLKNLIFSVFLSPIHFPYIPNAVFLFLEMSKNAKNKLNPKSVVDLWK